MCQNNIQNTPESQTRDGQHKVSSLSLATLLALISMLIQLVGLGFKILDYWQPTPPACMEAVNKSQCVGQHCRFKATGVQQSDILHDYQ